MMRACTSLEPPAVNAMIMLTGLLGYFAAHTGAALILSRIKAERANRKYFFMDFSSGVNSGCVTFKKEVLSYR
jgi:hypothetical protein